MENVIIRIIIRFIYEDTINNALNDDSNDIIKLEIKSTPKVINEFIKKYFYKYEDVLIVNALVYSIVNNDDSFINELKEVFKGDYNNYKMSLLNNIALQYKIADLAVKNIIGNCVIENSILIFKPDNNNKIIDNNKGLFDEILSNYIKVDAIFNYYRKIMFGFIEIAQKYLPDTDAFLNVFLESNTFDDEFLKYATNYIKKENLSFFKSVIKKMIICDNYVFSELAIEEYEDIFENDDVDIEEVEESNERLKIYRNILDYIEICSETNNFELPNDDEIKLEMINNFIVYEQDTSLDRQEDIKLIEEDPETHFKLKKINPLYKFDLLS